MSEAKFKTEEEAIQWLKDNNLYNHYEWRNYGDTAILIATYYYKKINNDERN